MSAFGVTDAALAGVRLLARRPAAALAWALVYALFLAAVIFIFGRLVFGLFDQFSVHGRLAVHGPRPNLPAILGVLAGMIGAYFLFLIGLLVVGGVITCAVIRAVIDPADSAFAYLRLGRRERSVILVNLCQALLVFIVSTVLAIPLAIIVALAVPPFGAQSIALRIGEQLLVNGVAYFIYLRLSMAAPMTFDEGRFRLFESWELTRAHAWRLLLVGLLVVAMGVVVYAAVGLIGWSVGAALWRGIPGLADPRAFFARPAGQWLPAFVPMLWLIGGLGVVLLAVITPMFIAPWAYIYRRLRPEDEIASTFA